MSPVQLLTVLLGLTANSLYLNLVPIYLWVPTSQGCCSGYMYGTSDCPVTFHG
jgi:hypothetical protein